MCVCVCVCVYVCMCACVCVCVCVCVQVCVYVCVHVCVSVFIMLSNHSIPVYYSSLCNILLFIPIILSHSHFLIFVISFLLCFYLISFLFFSHSPPLPYFLLPLSFSSLLTYFPSLPYLPLPSFTLPYLPLSLSTITPLVSFNRYSMRGPIDGRGVQRKSSLS